MTLIKRAMINEERIHAVSIIYSEIRSLEHSIEFNTNRINDAQTSDSMRDFLKDKNSAHLQQLVTLNQKLDKWRKLK